MASRSLDPAFLVLAAALCGCGDASATADEAGSTSGGDATSSTASSASQQDTGSGDIAETEQGESTGEPDVPACVPVGFAEPSTFTLPPGVGPLDSARGGGNCDAGVDGWAVREVTGDGFLDLIITHDCELDMSRATWSVYSGSPSGFSDTAVEWTLPRDHGEDGYYSSTGCHGCDFQMRDVDGDGLQDMLVAYVVAELSDGYWWLHRGTDSGFDHAGTPYEVPAGNMLLWSVGEDSCAGPPTRKGARWFPKFVVEDYTGDGRVDLVVEPECDAPVEDQTFAEVYVGGQNGFSASPMAWAMPPSAAEECVNGSLRNEVIDIDGDGQLEFVDTVGCRSYDACEPSEWLVYEPQPDGYTAEPRAFTVRGKAACQGITDRWDEGVRWLDFTRDGVPDVLSADGVSGNWALEVAGPDGLEPTLQIQAPTVAGQPLGRLMVDSEALAYELVQFDAAGPPSVVVTVHPEDPAVGTTHWEVYAFECEDA